jgi:hypothetical protein
VLQLENVEGVAAEAARDRPHEQCGTEWHCPAVCVRLGERSSAEQ